MSGDIDLLKKKAGIVCELLIDNYGDKIVERKLPPIDELILTILSQNTNDVNMFRAFKSLKEKYVDWNEVLNAPEEEIGQAIVSSGFFRVKAKRIKATLQEIMKRRGSLDIAFLEDMPVEEATEWLTSLHGVGPKTAAIVLLFCFEKSTLPVDTHVWRLSKRLGLVPKRTSREKTQTLLESLIPPKCIFSLNHNLIKHGRTICKARTPLCEDCFLQSLCRYYSEKSR